MKTSVRKMALGGILTAMALAIMLLGAVIGIGTYAAPLLAGIVLLPLADKFGWKSGLLAFAATGLLSLMLLTDREQSVLFLTFFGWYPIAAPGLNKLSPRALRWVVKWLLFNGAILGGEWIVLKLFAPEILSSWMILLLMVLANGIFLLYDKILPRMTLLLRRRLVNRFFPGR